jgi:hypothetical protein
MQIPPVATDQAGLFSRQQALEALASEGALRRALRAGSITPYATGVYGEAQLARSDRRTRHLLEARAAILSLGDEWCVARRTAAVLLGLPLLGRAPSEVQLTRARSTTSIRSSSRHRRINALLEAERTLVDGLATTTLARTVFDLARTESLRSGVVTADAALRSGLPREELVRVLDAHRGWPGVRRARTALAFADGRSESPLESLGRLTCLEEDLPVFEPQVEVWLDGELIARVDGLWREQLVVFEGDGAMKFDGEGVLPALLMRQERLREAGLPVVRAGWHDLTRRRKAWALGARRDLTERAGRPRPDVQLVATRVRPTPLDRSDHYRWPPLPALSTEHAALDTAHEPSARRVA